MKRIPKNITIGEIWDTGPWYWRFWIFCPFIPVVTVLGSLVISISGGSPLWFILGFPVAIVMMFAFNIWNKRISE